MSKMSGASHLLEFWISFSTMKFLGKRPRGRSLPVLVEYKRKRINVVVEAAKNGILLDWQLYLLRVTYPRILHEVIRQCPQIPKAAIHNAKFLNNFGGRVL